VAGLLLAGIAAAGCRRSSPSSDAPTTPAEQTYTVRGRVVRLPSPPRQNLVVHHEPIPGFVDRTGTVVGMSEMEMDFGWLAPGCGVEGVGEGDLVELKFEVRWRSSPPTLVTAIRRLEPGAGVNIRPMPPD
jgi:hypothetical protein